MDKDEQISNAILEYMLHQKMLGRDRVNESEIMEALGIPWDNRLEDRCFVLTEAGENYYSQVHEKKKWNFL